VKTRDFVIFCRQLATLVRAGITVADAVQIVERQTESKTLRKTLFDINQQIRAGTRFSVACESYPKIFPPVFVNMLRAGEASGNLDDVLERLALFFEKEHAVKEKIKSALAYPVTVTVIALFVTAFLMWKVVPRFVSTFSGLGIELPPVTRLVIAVSDSVAAYYWLYLSLPIFLYLLVRLIARDARGKYVLDYVALRMPVFGKLLQKSVLARFARTFSSLYASAVPMLTSLDIVGKVVGNAVISRLIEEAKAQLQKGQSLSAPFRTSPLIPPMVTHMLAVGEQTGTIDAVLEKVADFYEAEVEQTAERLKSLLEPILIMFVASLVGTIVLAILLPSFTLYQHLQ
jgi:type IV pilus assembly protein PilC